MNTWERIFIQTNFRNQYTKYSDMPSIQNISNQIIKDLFTNYFEKCLKVFSVCFSDIPLTIE